MLDVSQNVYDCLKFETYSFWEAGYIRSLTLSVRGSTLTSESDVWRRQILTYKAGPRTERINIFLTAVDP